MMHADYDCARLHRLGRMVSMYKCSKSQGTVWDPAAERNKTLISSVVVLDRKREVPLTAFCEFQLIWKRSQLLTCYAKFFLARN